MTTRTLIGLAVALTALGAGTPAPAQEPVPAPGDRGASATAELSTQVDELNRTLREIADLLRRQLEGQQADQLMKRIEMQRRSLAPLEQELRDARSEQHGLTENLRELEAHSQLFDEEMRGDAQQPISLDEPNYAAEKKRLDVQIDLLRERLEASDAKVYELEGQLQSRQAEIRTWEEMLDEALGLR